MTNFKNKIKHLKNSGSNGLMSDVGEETQSLSAGGSIPSFATKDK